MVVFVNTVGLCGRLDVTLARLFLPLTSWAYRHALFQSATFVAYGLSQSASKIFCSAATTSLAFVFQLAPAVW